MIQHIPSNLYTTMKKLLIGILCASIISPSFVFADNGSNRGRGNDDNRRSGEIEIEIEQHRSGDDSNDDRRRGGDDERISLSSSSSMRGEDSENRGKSEMSRVEKTQKKAEKIIKRFEAAISRIQRLSDRVTERLNMFEAQGVNVSASRAHLANAKIKLTEATTKTAAIEVALDSAIASSTTKTELKAALRNVEVQVKDVKRTLQGAHRDVALAILSVKPGFNTPAPATTTPDVLAPVISNVAVTAVSSTTATVSWNTNEVATGKLSFGTSTPPTTFVSTTTLSTGHSFNLVGLMASSTYNLLMESKDAAGNTATTSATFVTAI